MREMRIGLNLLYLLPGIVGGTETYAAGLLNGLSKVDGENEYLVFVNSESASWPIPERENFRRILCPVKASNRANMKSCFNKGEIFGGELIAANIDTRSELGFPAEKRW